MLRTVLGCGIFLQTVNKYEWSLYPIVLSVNDIKLMHRNSYSSFFSMLSIVHLSEIFSNGHETTNKGKKTDKLTELISTTM